MYTTSQMPQKSLEYIPRRKNWTVQLKNSFPLLFFFSFHFVRIRNELMDVTKVGPSEFSSGPFCLRVNRLQSVTDVLSELQFA